MTERKSTLTFTEDENARGCAPAPWMQRLAFGDVRHTQRWLDTLESPEATAAGCTWLLAVLGDVSDLASARRAAAVHQLTVDGWSLSEIGAALGISRARVHQLVNR